MVEQSPSRSAIGPKHLDLVDGGVLLGYVDVTKPEAAQRLALKDALGSNVHSDGGNSHPEGEA